MTRFQAAMILAWVLVIVGPFLTMAFARYGSDGFVRLIEQQQGVVPGQTRVVPQCGCTVRYNGTQIRGRHYLVDIERLD